VPNQNSNRRLRSPNHSHYDSTSARARFWTFGRTALAFLKNLDDLSAREKFNANIGPAALHDSDDPSTMHFLERVLSTLPHLNASAIIADQSGIHWKSIRRSAQLIKYVTENSPRGQGNFNFAVTAMLKPYTPFYPGSYHNGNGRQFAFGFETANVVRDVFAKDTANVEAAISDLTIALTVHAKLARFSWEQSRSCDRLDLSRFRSYGDSAWRCVDRDCDRSLYRRLANLAK